MDVMVLALVLVGLAVFVAAPLYRKVEAPPRIGPSDRARRDAVAADLEDLEIDRASGLYDDTDYADERRTLERRLPTDRPAAPTD